MAVCTRQSGRHSLQDLPKEIVAIVWPKSRAPVLGCSPGKSGVCCSFQTILFLNFYKFFPACNSIFSALVTGRCSAREESVFSVSMNRQYRLMPSIIFCCNSAGRSLTIERNGLWIWLEKCEVIKSDLKQPNGLRFLPFHSEVFIVCIFLGFLFFDSLIGIFFFLFSPILFWE